MRRLLARARDEAGIALVALGYLVMTDEAAVEVAEAVAETVAGYRDLGRPATGENPTGAGGVVG